MLHFKTKTDLLFDNLRSRLSHIKVIADSLKLIDHPKRNYKGLYKEIAFYVHAIMSQIETKRLFINIIQYRKNLDNNPEYVKLIESINSNVRSIARIIKAHPKYANLVNSQTSMYFNPNLNPPALHIDNLLTSFETFNFSDGPDDDYLYNTGKVLEKILQNMGNCDFGDTAEILNEINLYHEKLKKFDFFYNFQFEFHGSSSARSIALIYTTLNPLIGQEGDFYHLMLVDNIGKGVTIKGEENLEILVNDCEKVFQYFREKLNTQLVIESYIDRFTTYIALYYVPDYKQHLAEVELQKKFQEFLFNAGYYPISEAELNDGRLDTIANDQTNAFLFEIKQFDLGSTDEKDSSLVTKIKSAQVQSSIYLDRLHTYPNLSHFVFIILFTNRKVSYKDSIDRIVKDGITYILKSITVYQKSPSQVRTDVQIDIFELIKN